MENKRRTNKRDTNVVASKATLNSRRTRSPYMGALVTAQNRRVIFKTLIEASGGDKKETRTEAQKERDAKDFLNQQHRHLEAYLKAKKFYKHKKKIYPVLEGE